MELVWDELCENQRWVLRKGWQSCPQIRIDPSQWTNSAYQQLPSIYDHRLPASENENLRWVWVDDWQSTNWKYAISFGAAFGTFTFKEKSCRKHFVRQRKWKRPRIRKMQIGTTEIREQVIENQRILIKKWKSPYLPGDPPHYCSNNGHLLTTKQVESRLPPSWIWLECEWNVEIGQHTDKNGWQFAPDFHVGQWSNKFTPVLNSVRRKQLVRTRKLSGLIKETKKLDMKRSKTWSRSKTCTPSDSHSNIKQIVIDEDDIDIDIDDGWDDDQEIKSAVPPNPPFEIAVCWKYDKVFLETKKRSDSKSATLAIWKPKVDNEEDADEKSDVFILGYLGLNHCTDPNDNIPMLAVKNGSDKHALSPPANFKLVHKEKIRRKSPKNNKEVNVYRYWLALVPPDGYVAMGSIVVDKYHEAIDENLFDYLKEYFWSVQQKKYLQLYSLDKLRCLHAKYVDEFGQPLVEKLLTSNKYHYILHRPQPIVVSGIYKLVEMACIIGGVDVDDNQHHSACIRRDIFDVCVARLQYEIRIVGDSPLIISSATHFTLSWSSKRLTTTSNTKAAVWQPVLGADEFMVGHLAFGDWHHPAAHDNNCKLLIIKSGGSDPDAFKEPLGFECIWSVYKPGQKHQLRKSKGVGTGLILTKVAGTVGLVDDEAPPSGSFWRAIPQQGYTALGDIALPIDGHVLSVNDDGTKKKVLSQILRSHDVAKYVCIKNEYLANFRELEVDEIKDNESNIFDSAKGKLQSSILENKVRSRVWCSERAKGLSSQARIYEQEPVTRDILSPMFCKNGLQTPESNELFPTLNIKHVIEAMPYWNVMKAGILKKKGEGFYAKSHKRYFVLTNEKVIDYYDEIEKKGNIKLMKMRNCGVVKGSNKEFYIECSDRKWELEVVNENISGGTAKEWVSSIQYVFEGEIGGGDDMGFDEWAETIKSSETSVSITKSSGHGIVIEEKESQQEKIVKLLTKMLKRFAELLKHTATENETTETVEAAVKWYEDLENTRSAIDILLAKWPRGTICPPGVVRARAQLKDLMEQSRDVILCDIRALANENMSNFTVLRLHKACGFMSDLDKGQKLICEHITDILLRNAATEFSAGGKYCALQHIERRFNEYRRQMKEYDKRYNLFIPKWWDLPIKIASRFCSLMGETLDDQLTRFPENHDSISLAKQKCVLFEQELIEDAMRRICCLEIDVRSWAKWDAGDPVSYIKIDDENVMLPGGGLCVIAIDLFTKKILKKKLFPLYKYSAWKKSDKHRKIIRDWLLYLNDIDEQTLIVMASHEWCGQCEFKKALGTKGLPKELQALNLTAADMANENNLFENKGAFIYIGRKGRKDSYFTVLSKSKSAGPIMARHIISPYIPKNRLAKLCDIEQIPFYEGIISQVLERHLDIFVGEEAKNVQQILGNVLNEESISVLEEKKSWLSTINKMDLKQKSSAHLESVANIANAMKLSIESCMKISTGKPLFELLRKYSQMLQEYGSLLLKLITDAGGHKFANKLNLSEDEKGKLTSENGQETKKRRFSNFSLPVFGNNIISNVKKLNSQNWSDKEIQFFIIYCCMIYNTCNKARDLLNELLEIGQKDLQKKYANGCKSELIECRQLFFSMEEECLELIGVSVMDKFEFIFEFEKHSNWQLDNYKKELMNSFDLYLSNCSKLLNPSALEHFYKIFCAHFALKLFEKILDSNALNASSNVLIDFAPIFQTVVIKKIPPRIIKKMQIFMNRCLNPVIKLIQLAYANAGEKYDKLQSVKTEKEINSKNIFSKFFGGVNKNKNIENKEKENEIDTTKQMKTRQKTAISNTVFAQKAVQFYTDNGIKLEILKNIPSYKEIFAEDEDENIETINETLNDLKKVEINDIKQEKEEEKIVDINELDGDYFGRKTTKSVSGFTVKKTKKKKKKMAPSMTAPRVPFIANNEIKKSKPMMSVSMSEPAPKGDKNKDIASIGVGIGLSAISLIVPKVIKVNMKWKVIQKVMALRGFHVSDQQTIRILCEDAHENIQKSR